MIDISEFDVKQQKLEYAKNELKKRFFGIDHIIDDIISRISSWYMFPDLNTRPTILCLWGMTGVGKTDLVRNLISLLELGEHFHEIQLSGSSKTYETTISSALRYSKLRPNTQGILLLDEIQRYRTVTERGEEKNDYNYSDMWMLLSDGKLPTDSCFESLLELLFDVEEHERKITEPPPIKEGGEGEVSADKVESPKTAISRWRAKDLKKNLKIEDSIETIMNWNSHNLREQIMRISKQDSLERNYDNYSKLLIIISGNLDEAFTESFNVEDADCDADMMHELTKRINMLHIKSALLDRFKPEQIARFGNNHILYPTLPKFAFENIIERSLTTYFDFLYNLTGIEVTMTDRSIINMLYNNSVFPSQGTRPVFSTVSDFTNVCFPDVILNALKNNITNVKVWWEGTAFKTSTGVTISYKPPLDEVRKNTLKDKQLQTIVAVHEAGHALVQMKLFGVAPFQLKLHNDGAGALWGGKFAFTKASMEAGIQTLYAGHVAERLIFGENHVSQGASQDISRVTSTVANMVRMFGMVKDKTTIISPVHGEAHSYDVELEESNQTVRYCANELYNKTIKLLEMEKTRIATLANMLLEKRMLTSQELATFGERILGKPIRSITSEQVNELLYVYDYVTAFEKFIKK